MEHDSLCKLAEILDDVDRHFGLNREYGPNFPRPEDVLFGVSEKRAHSLLRDHCQLTSGSIYKVADFAKVSLDDLRGVMGDEFVDEVTRGLDLAPEKLAELATTLPRPDADLLERVFAASGVEPVHKEASYSHGGVTDEELYRLSDLRT